ncbi:hypothetical protein BN1058_02738 [Paraliobacillus sp. PM-2]|uniref:hypothetical protein n=1 Tax=Paraliobacillus sp. PM-2 TaxID=1462524 RepID=UPI00061BCF36|nr:hypothetical protein [Paraliobacillus sp. PM-2]CQR48370.1 hypothetical protein BN1058_02738 [Paraliobacillus sp. PM-2]
MTQRRVIAAKAVRRSGGCGCSKRRMKRKKKNLTITENSNSDNNSATHVTEIKEE